ncbi:hypothetical protein [Variovorax ginsengisoli]|uniref:Uncharacterized protein n=1 Tax=Variovorax ginsengisoli TaxID=363844 RepID=A0ABT9SC61_9BURK|nr:hypothetical protein [Variovorax ginsengisoli]MDP9901932.1 hypothetical protein [Variovorax ginsengisoli]
MSTTTFTASGSLDDRKSQPVRCLAESPATARVQATVAAPKRASWLHFANHMATWATAGRLPLSE